MDIGVKYRAHRAPNTVLICWRNVIPGWQIHICRYCWKGGNIHGSFRHIWLSYSWVCCISKYPPRPVWILFLLVVSILKYPSIVVRWPTRWSVPLANWDFSGVHGVSQQIYGPEKVVSQYMDQRRLYDNTWTRERWLSNVLQKPTMANWLERQPSKLNFNFQTISIMLVAGSLA